MGGWGCIRIELEWDDDMNMMASGKEWTDGNAFMSMIIYLFDYMFDLNVLFTYLMYLVR